MPRGSIYSRSISTEYVLVTSNYYQFAFRLIFNYFNSFNNTEIMKVEPGGRGSEGEWGGGRKGCWRPIHFLNLTRGPKFLSAAIALRQTERKDLRSKC